MSGPRLVLDVDSAVAHVRAGRPVTIGTGTDAVTCLPAAVLASSVPPDLTTHGPPTVVLSRSLAARLHLRRGPVAVEGGDTMATFRALASPWTTRAAFRSDPAGVPVVAVPDGGVVEDCDPLVLASELSTLAGFGPVTVVAPRAVGPPRGSVRAEDLIRTALRARGPLRAIGPARLPLAAGSFVVFSVRAWDGAEHVVLVAERGPARAARPGAQHQEGMTRAARPGAQHQEGMIGGPVRVVPACVLGQAFASGTCGCRHTLDEALADAATTGARVVVLQARRAALAVGTCGAHAVADDPTVPVLVEEAVAAVTRAAEKTRTA